MTVRLGPYNIKMLTKYFPGAMMKDHFTNGQQALWASILLQKNNLVL